MELEFEIVSVKKKKKRRKENAYARRIIRRNSFSNLQQRYDDEWLYFSGLDNICDINVTAMCSILNVICIPSTTPFPPRVTKGTR